MIRSQYTVKEVQTTSSLYQSHCSSNSPGKPNKVALSHWVQRINYAGLRIWILAYLTLCLKIFGKEVALYPYALLAENTFSLVTYPLQTHKSSQLQDVCWLIWVSVSSGKSLQQLEVCWLIRDSISSDKSSWLQEFCWLVESMSSNRSSSTQKVCWLIVESMSSNRGYST